MMLGGAKSIWEMWDNITEDGFLQEADRLPSRFFRLFAKLSHLNLNPKGGIALCVLRDQLQRPFRCCS